MGKNKRDRYLVVVKDLIIQDRSGKKFMTKMLNEGYEVVSIQKRTVLRSSLVTFQKPNPDYQG